MPEDNIVVLAFSLFFGIIVIKAIPHKPLKIRKKNGII